MSIEEGTVLSADHLKEKLADNALLATHEQAANLIAVAIGGSSLSSSGYPFIVQESFRLFVDKVPHLFRDGQRILDWVDRLDEVVEASDLTEDDETCLKRTRKVLRNMVFTAGVTAPPDLWLIRQVLSVHVALGLRDAYLNEALTAGQLAERFGVDEERLAMDLHFLYSRGYLEIVDGTYSASSIGERTLADVQEFDPGWRTDITALVIARLRGLPKDDGMLDNWLKFEMEPESSPCWIANLFQIELGYRLLPLVLALRACELTPKLKMGVTFAEYVTNSNEAMSHLLNLGGLIDDAGVVTRLGARVFQRGPGPFGIIGAYHSYLNHLEALLRKEPVGSWVSRGENVAASQDANRKTFLAANDAIDAFCDTYGFSYKVIIEHAVGRGEATRQRYERDKDQNLLYFGADLEDAAIDEAIKQQGLGFLPKNMRFIRNADIGKPYLVTDQLANWGVASDGAIMLVGNGFHEVRGQTNEQMKQVFKGYQEAGIFLVFTEESALSDQDLLNTAWNTYHAGFRYVHELSGQGLRPAHAGDNRNKRWSWPRCARKAGYVILSELSHRTRTIYPFKKKSQLNPSISVTYFCVPEKWADQLGIF